MKGISRAGVLLFLLLIFWGCAARKASPPSEGDVLKGKSIPAPPALAAYWNTWSNDGVPLFFGASQRMRYRDNEWQTALEAAASQAARYVQVTGESLFYVEKTGREMGHFGDFQFRWDTALEDSLLEELEEVGRFQDDDGSYVLVRYPRGRKVKLPPRNISAVGRPGWILKPPKFSGYWVGIGSSQRNRYLSDSLAAADEQALEEVVKAINMEAFFQEGSIDRGKKGSVAAHRYMEVARATVRGFYILARWYEPDRGRVYSLGICPKKQD